MGSIWNVKWVVVITAELCCVLTPVWATGRPVDSIYDPGVLSTLQYKYSSWFVGNEQHPGGVFDEVIKSQFNGAERKKLADVPLQFPENLPGLEPFGFVCDGKRISLSVASLKFFDDLIVAYVWLGRHHYSLDTVNDYLRMLHRWSKQEPPPEPLKALGIPDNALGDTETKRAANLYMRNVYTIILLHELGHFYNGDPPSWEGRPPKEVQAKEAEADRFALELVGRIGTVPTGIAQFFTWLWAYMPNRADPDYEAELQAQTHPLAARRLIEVAEDIEQNASTYAIDASRETLAEFRELANLYRKLAALLDTSDIQQHIARRAKMLEPRDLAPRRPNEIISRPIGSRAGNGPFAGKLAGTVAGRPVEVFVENESGRVTGTLGVGPELAELVRIEGVVEDDTLSFTWKSADSQGRGELHRDGNTYISTSPLGPAKDGSIWVVTAPEAIPNISGVWQDVGAPDNTTHVTQRGKKFEFSRRGMLPTGVGFESTGSGELKGQNFIANYSTEYQNHSTSTGECFGQVSSDGRNITESCMDSNYSFTISISAVRR